MTYPEAGTPQGGVISPILSNIYLHEVRDRWFVEQIKPKLLGQAELIRYADDFIVVCERREDAETLLEKATARFQSYGLTIHPEKTRIVDFRHPWKSKDKPQTFDFLGFTHYWEKTRRGGYAVKRKTKGKKLRAALVKVGEWCKEHRHEPMEEQHKALTTKVLGHMEYYGIRGNFRALGTFCSEVKRLWCYWLSRRSREKQNRQRLWELLDEHFPLPRPHIVHPATPHQLAWSFSS